MKPSKRRKRNEPKDTKPRCGAKTRAEGHAPCKRRPSIGRARCKLHGGAKGNGAQKKNANAATHGLYSQILRGEEIPEFSVALKQLVDDPRDILLRCCAFLTVKLNSLMRRQAGDGLTLIERTEKLGDKHIDVTEPIGRAGTHLAGMLESVAKISVGRGLDSDGDSTEVTPAERAELKALLERLNATPTVQ